MAKQTTSPTTRATGPRQVPSRQAPARRPVGTRAKTKENVPTRPFQMPFDRKNMFIIFTGIGVIILGYLLMYLSPVMSTMAITISPIILLLGYCVIVPFGIMAGIRGNRKQPSATEPSSESLTSKAGVSSHATPNAV